MFAREVEILTSDAAQLALADERDNQTAFSEWAAEKNCPGVRHPDTTDAEWRSFRAGEEAGNCGVKEFVARRKRALRAARKRFNAEKACREWLSDLAAARRLDFLQMCVDKARHDLAYAMCKVKEWRRDGIAD